MDQACSQAVARHFSGARRNQKPVQRLPRPDVDASPIVEIPLIERTAVGVTGSWDFPESLERAAGIGGAENTRERLIAVKSGGVLKGRMRFGPLIQRRLHVTDAQGCDPRVGAV